VEARLGRGLALPVDFALSQADDHLGWRAENDGTLTLGLHVESGRVKEKLRTALRSVVERVRPELRLTPQQNVLIVGVAWSDRALIDELFAAHGVSTDPAAKGAHRYATACPALPTCGLALTDAERALPAVVDEIAETLEELGLEEERLSIRMTGCPNGCARPYMGDIGFVGRSKDLYDIFLGGDFANTRLNWLFKAGVRRDRLAAELAPLLRGFAAERTADEGFGDYCTRVRHELSARTHTPALVP
jgi:sulfite reductase (ferredoxin)